MLFQVTVIPTEIDFDKVVFMESVTRSLTVANNGQVSWRKARMSTFDRMNLKKYSAQTGPGEIRVY